MLNSCLDLDKKIMDQYSYLTQCVKEGTLKRSQLKLAIIDLIEYCEENNLKCEVLKSWVK